MINTTIFSAVIAIITIVFISATLFVSSHQGRVHTSIVVAGVPGAFVIVIAVQCLNTFERTVRNRFVNTAVVHTRVFSAIIFVTTVKVD